MKSNITDKKLEKYFSITEEALAMAKKSHLNNNENAAEIFDMVERYVSDAEHFRKKGDSVNAFACLNYAHGWLDCGAKLKVFAVKDSRLFTVDDD